MCGVSHGDSPLSIAWLKDGVPVLLQDDGVDPSAAATANTGTGSGDGDGAAVVVTTLDLYSSLLSIPRLTRHHTGRYTCQAQNPAAQVRYTAVLLVKGKCRSGGPLSTRALAPKILIAPSTIYTYFLYTHTSTYAIIHARARFSINQTQPLDKTQLRSVRTTTIRINGLSMSMLKKLLDVTELIL